MLIVLSGPSGVGKSLTLQYLVSWNACETVIPFTTRQKRLFEVEGLDYHFRSEAILRSLFDDFRIGYWDQPIDVNWYGYSAMVDAAAAQAQDTVIQASSAIALALKTRHPQTQLIFCDFASDNTMHRRIRLRCGSSASELRFRLRHARVERSRKGRFDAVVTSDDPLELREGVVHEFERITR